MKLGKSIISMLVFINLLSSCRIIAGISEIKPVNSATIEKTLKEKEISLAFNHELDVQGYKSFLKTFSKEDKELFSNLSQPLQIILFHKDTAVAHLINCNIGGFPVLSWNKYNNFDSFPLKNYPFSSPSRTPVLSDYIKFLKPQNTSDISSNEEYSIIVTWAAFLNRNNTNFLTLTRDYMSKFNIRKAYYINFDNYLYSFE